MTHERFEEQISELLDGELADGDLLELTHHLSTCESCRDFLQATTRARSALQKISAPNVPPTLDARLRRSVEYSRAVLKDRPAVAGSLKRRMISVPFPAAALFVIMLLLGGILFLSTLTYQPQSASPFNQPEFRGMMYGQPPAAQRQ